MAVLTKIEDFRNLAEDLEIIINKSESIKKLKEKPMMKKLVKRKRKFYLKKKRKLGLREKLYKKNYKSFQPEFQYLCILQILERERLKML